MSERFGGKVAVITGGARGMGLATAQRLAQEGGAVALLDIEDETAETAAAVIREAGRTALYIHTDVGDEASVKAAADVVRREWGRADYLVNIAGINAYGTLEGLTLEQWDRVMRVNVGGVFLMLKYFTPLLRAAGGGAVVNMSSVSAFIGSEGYSVYHASKGAVNSLTKGAAQELAQYHIRVNAVAPGWVDTAFTDEGVNRAPDPEGLRAYANTLHLTQRIGKPEEIAAAICFLLSDDAAFITGETLFVDGGFMIKR